MSDNLIKSSMEGIRDSDCFMVLGTENYANSIRDPNEVDHHLLVSQIAYAKSLGKPVIILLESSLGEEDKKTIMEVLEGMELIGVFEFEADNEESMRNAVIEMRKAIAKRRGEV